MPVARSRVVVTGVGCVSPNGVGRENFTAACIDARSGLKPTAGPEFAGLRTAAIGSVDVDLHGVLPAPELRRMPRLVPLALLASREAVQHARLPLDDLSISRRTALVLGTGGGGLAFVEEQCRSWFQEGRGSPYAIVGGTHGNLAGELSIALGIRGASHVVSTGCASSTDALGYAMLLIQSGRADAVICGGADAPIAPGILLGFERMGVLSTHPWPEPAMASRPFSASRDGFILGEGAWMFVVESEESAERRGAWRDGCEPLAELAGYGSTSDAYHRVRIAPDVAECVRAMRLALEDAGATPEDVDLVNLHGTGTELNDRLETLAMKKLLGERAASVPMNATKSLIGHPQGAGGAAGVAAAILCAREGFIHPTLNLTDPDPECDLDYVPLAARPIEAARSIDTARPLSAGGGRLLLCNCIAFGSKNSALALRLPPAGRA